MEPTLFKDLVRVFLSDFPDGFSHLRAARENRDAHQSAEWAHRLKGSASTLGAVLLTQLFQNIEKQAGMGAWDTIGLLLRQTDDEFCAVQNKLQTYLDE